MDHVTRLHQQHSKPMKETFLFVYAFRMCACGNNVDEIEGYCCGPVARSRYPPQWHGEAEQGGGGGWRGCTILWTDGQQSNGVFASIGA